MRAKSDIPAVFAFLKLLGWRIIAGSVEDVMTSPNNGLLVLRRYSSYSDLEAAAGIARIEGRYITMADLGLGGEEIGRYRDPPRLNICTAVRGLERQLLGPIDQEFQDDMPKRKGPTTDEVLNILHDILHGPRDRYYLP